MPAPIDPFFPEVFLLMPFSGVGDTLVDYSNQSANTSVIPGGTLANGIFTQDTARTLFGLPTLHVQKAASLTSQYRLVRNSVYPIVSTDDVCFEFMLYQSFLNAGTMSPQYWRFAQRSGATTYNGQAVSLNSSGAAAASPVVTTNNPVLTGVNASAAIAGQWQYAVMQFVASESTLYSYLNSVPVSRDFFPANTPMPWTLGSAFTGYQMVLAIGGAVLGYDISMAQLRATKANRYGLNAGNYLTNIPPTPTAPWPLTGP